METNSALLHGTLKKEDFPAKRSQHRTRICRAERAGRQPPAMNINSTSHNMHTNSFSMLTAPAASGVLS
jgi:hypothetical protein